MCLAKPVSRLDVDPVAERLLVILTETGLSARALSKKAGASHGFVQSIIDGHSKSPSADRLRAVADAAGYSRAWLTSGDGPPKLSASLRLVSDRIHPTIERVGKVARYSDEEIEAASGMVRGLDGTADMTEEQANELLMRARMTRRDAERIMALPPKIAPVIVEDDDIAQERLPTINPRRKR